VVAVAAAVRREAATAPRSTNAQTAGAKDA
jgi:hypothetical protein